MKLRIYVAYVIIVIVANTIDWSVGRFFHSFQNISQFNLYFYDKP